VLGLALDVNGGVAAVDDADGDCANDTGKTGTDTPREALLGPDSPTAASSDFTFNSGVTVPDITRVTRFRARAVVDDMLCAKRLHSIDIRPILTAC
jgi:hypothetical protein